MSTWRCVKTVSYTHLAAEEHQRRSAQCHSDYVTHSSRQVGVQNWSEDISQKTGKGECGDNPYLRQFEHDELLSREVRSRILAYVLVASAGQELAAVQAEGR